MNKRQKHGTEGLVNRMSKTITYTSDDEEPVCGRCNHVVDSDKWCMEQCGGANSWNGYERTEEIDE